jgi:hypothetical protein
MRRFECKSDSIACNAIPSYKNAAHCNVQSHSNYVAGLYIESTAEGAEQVSNVLSGGTEGYPVYTYVYVCVCMPVCVSMYIRIIPASCMYFMCVCVCM